MRKSARFVIDTHVHSQRHAAGKALKEKRQAEGKKGFDYLDLESQMGMLETYDNSKRLLYDMDCYGVDMCILQCAFGMTNELNVELMQKYPDKFRCMAISKRTADAAIESGEWSIKDACKELDELLAPAISAASAKAPPACRTAPMEKSKRHIVCPTGWTNCV